MRLPKISILTPSYNSELFLRECINNVLDQEYENFEHIIVDGGSSDNSVTILSEYPHVKWLSEKDKGQSDAMNKAFKMSDGDIISYLNTDDKYMPGALQYVGQYFQTKSSKSFLLGNLLHNYNGKVENHIPKGHIFSLINYMTYSFPLNPACYFYRRSVQEKIGDFPIENHYTMDYWFLLRAFYMYKVEKVNYDFGFFTFREGQKSSFAHLSTESIKTDRKEFLKNKPFLKMLSKIYGNTFLQYKF